MVNTKQVTEMGCNMTKKKEPWLVRISSGQPIQENTSIIALTITSEFTLLSGITFGYMLT